MVICDYAGKIPGIMKAFIVLVAFLALASCEDECYRDIDYTCQNSVTLTKQQGLPTQCNSKYGGIDIIQSDLQKFTNDLFSRSFDFLLMATHYGNYIKNRPGFEKLYRGLSDELWEDGIDTIKFITSRGGQMNFNNVPQDLQAQQSLELYELQSLGKALDIEKKLATEAFDIHKDTSGHRSDHYDPEISHHLEDKFMEKHRETIRKLAGYTKDLSKILDESDANLGLYLFDEYLQK